MSTHARIGRRNADRTISSVYLHFDGSPGKVLPRLRAAFIGGRAIDGLIRAGNLLTLDGKRMSPPVAARGARGLIELLEQGRDCGAEYVYLYDCGSWLHYTLRAEVLR